MLLSLIAWVVLGMLAGALANRTASSRGMGLPLSITLGLIGAMIGGGFLSISGTVGLLGFNVASLFGAVIGAAVVLSVAHALRGGASKPGARRA